MSYGVWKKRGSNWSSIEIDGAGDTEYQWESLGQDKAKKLRDQATKLGINPWASYLESDFFFTKWAIGQRKKGWKIYSVSTDSDHSLWVAVRTEADLELAKGVLGHKLDGKAVALAAPKSVYSGGI